MTSNIAKLQALLETYKKIIGGNFTITTNQDAYEALAIELATSPQKLDAIKSKLLNNLPSAPLYNTKLFTKHIESAYQAIYQRYLDDLCPEHIYIG